MSISKSKNMITVPEAAERLEVSGTRVRKMLQDGLLRGVKYGSEQGGVWEVYADSVEERGREVRKEYRCHLKNEDGIFATGHFTSKNAAREWAKGRGKNYTLVIENAEGEIIEEKRFLRDRSKG